MKLEFLGASETVTGSKYLLTIRNRRYLIDCGLFQGKKELRLLNWAPPSFDPREIEAVLLTHGHLDHVGYLPRLVKLGFKGKIYGTRPTLKIASIILKDTAEIQEEEAARANREGYSKHHPALPLYDLHDVKKTIRLFDSIDPDETLELNDGCTATFHHNGHILGSCFIEFKAGRKTLVFSGDIGREEDFLLYPPLKPKKADVLLMETTYGGRLHLEEEGVIPQLERIINETFHRRGTVFIASFAVERAQLLMYMLWQLKKENRIPKMPMVLDSPMGADILDLFKDTSDWHKLSSAECKELAGAFHIVSSFKETLKLVQSSTPRVIIAGAGMLTGGRILNYLEARGQNTADTLVLAGYQAEGTRGRDLLHGAKSLKMYGHYVPFNMHLEQLEGLSAHADQQGLLEWLEDLEEAPEKLFLVHGELSQSEAFKEKLLEVKGWEALIPKLGLEEEV